MYTYHYVNGKVVSFQDAKISIADLSIHRSIGVFDFFMVLNWAPTHLDQHLKRFRRSLSLLGISIDTSDTEIIENIYLLIEMNNIETGGIKLIATGGSSSDGFTVESPSLLIQCLEIKLPDDNVYSQGASLHRVEYMRILPEAKTTNYLVSFLHQKKKEEMGAIDVVYSYQGNVYECSRGNIFFIKDKVIYTAASKILLGVTRSIILDSAKNQYSIKLGPCPVELFNTADEIFITSTIKKVVPIVAVDDIKVKDGSVGPVTKHIMDLYNDHIKSEIVKDQQGLRV